jgi:hypothetical protein
MPEHLPGCLHSKDPDVIIQDKFRLVDSVYWKRCDGTFKNIHGVELVVKGKRKTAAVERLLRHRQR